MDQKNLKNQAQKPAESPRKPSYGQSEGGTEGAEGIEIRKEAQGRQGVEGVESAEGAKNLKSGKSSKEATGQNLRQKLKISSRFKKSEDSYKQKYQKMKEDYLYLRAEFENYKKRTFEEKRQSQLYEGERFISDLANEVLDDFERALSSFEEKPSLEVMDKGLKMIHTKCQLLLKKHAVSSLDPKGKAFDPSYQEALSYVENSKYPEGHVVETYKKAYKLHDKVIRPAQVVVAKEKESPT